MQDCRLEVVDVHLVLGCKVSEFIGFSIRQATFNATTRHPDAHAVWVMVATEIRRVISFLIHRCPAKFSAPDNECLVKKSPLFEIAQECMDRLIDFFALLGEMFDNIVCIASSMNIPAPIEKLDIANAAFYQSASQQTVVGKGGFPRLRTVELVRVCRLFADVHHLRNTDLHSVSHLILRDAGIDFRTALLGQLHLIQLSQRIE